MLAACSVAQAFITRSGKPRFAQQEDRPEQIKQSLGANAPEEKWFDATIDHFTNHGAGGATY
jgi:hypothetical protein